MGLSGCDTLLDSRYQSSVPPGSGVERLQGVAKGAEIRRNSLGMPLISSDNLHDAIFALGYTHAGDRLSQMVGMRLMAEGRLAEMIGPGAVEIDRFMRTVNLKAASENLYRGASPQIRNTLEVYARGVNAYLYRYRDNLPMDLAESGFTVPWWKPEDSVLIFTLLNFGLSMNLQEEIAALVMAQQVGTEQLAWLMPIHPDEPLPFEEAERLKGLDLHGRISGLSQVAAATRQVADLDMLGVAASNNWAIAPAMSKGGKSLLANDTHLPLSLPSTWNYVQISTPKYRAAGVSIAGIPLVVAGFNGKLAWGMTMVMGDTQDLFLEQLKQENGQLLYLADGIWQPTRQRHETFIIKGAKPLREVIHETRNGPLLNSALGQRKHPLQPLQIDSSLGLALRSISMENDQSIDAFFNLTRAQSVEQAHEQVRNIRAISLNMLYADADNIAWQVTGRYPNRLAGRGLLPAPGWDSQYAWDGYADPMLHPYDQNPAQGWLGSANQRSVAPGYAVQLSSSWYYPERAERIAQLAAAGRHDTQSMIDMQYDQTSPFVPKLQAMLKGPFMQQPLQQAIDALPAGERQQAQAALQRLLAFNARLDPTSADAALYGAFLQESAKEIFLDELGPPDSPAWLALVDSANMSYSAQADHLLGRDDSPFWDDRRTPQVENKPAILARSLVLAQAFCEQQLGTDPGKWQWGKLHSYTWASDATQMAHLMSPAQQAGISALSSYLDRGPYPAGGDHSTLNVSAYHWGKNFDTWLIPAMRLIVDFNRDEPMLAMNSSGQSGNPASPHYADGIQAWLQGDYMSFPMQPANQEKVYGKAGLLLLPGK
jgi:acyl-homoserine-lactone acylase